MSNIIYLLVFAACAFLSALFSGSETGVYQLSKVRLRLGVEHKKLPYLILSKSLKDGAGLLISLLLGNNLANYFATSSMTYLLLTTVDTEYRAAMLATLISTPFFFVFCELIPKNLFFCRADELMPTISPFIYSFDKLARLCGLTPVLKKFGQLSGGRGQSPALAGTTLSSSRRYFETILTETHEEGMLSPTQARMVRRLGQISELPLRMVMIPLSDVRMVDVNSSKDDLLNICKKYPFTRYPVYEGARTNVIGVINIYQCLTSETDFTDVREFLWPVRKLPSDMNVADAINVMQKENKKMILVTLPGHRRRPVGIATMKDLVEELLGELTEW